MGNCCSLTESKVKIKNNTPVQIRVRNNYVDTVIDNYKFCEVPTIEPTIEIIPENCDIMPLVISLNDYNETEISKNITIHLDKKFSDRGTEYLELVSSKN